MVKTIAIGLLLSILLASGFTYAADDRATDRSVNSGRSSGFLTSNHPHAIFVGAKAGWVTVPAEESALPGALGQTTR
jgi:hypothetical protein